MVSEGENGIGDVFAIGFFAVHGVLVVRMIC
jgi:hypothetical protein